LGGVWKGLGRRNIEHDERFAVCPHGERRSLDAQLFGVQAHGRGGLLRRENGGLEAIELNEIGVRHIGIDHQ
jgi:hypothetical protein